MARVFSYEFNNAFWWQLTDDDLRFRSPPWANNIQCRLWKEKNKWQLEKWESYPVIEITKGSLVHVLTCSGIWPKWECPSWGWCAQFWYQDVVVTKT